MTTLSKPSNFPFWGISFCSDHLYKPSIFFSFFGHFLCKHTHPICNAKHPVPWCKSPGKDSNEPVGSSHRFYIRIHSEKLPLFLHGGGPDYRTFCVKSCHHSWLGQGSWSLAQEQSRKTYSTWRTICWGILELTRCTWTYDWPTIDQEWEPSWKVLTFKDVTLFFFRC